MPLSCHTTGAATIVTIEGKMDTANAPETTDQLKGLILAGGARIVLDLSGVTFMDSMALSVLVSALKLARKEGGDLVLLRPAPLVRSLLDVTRLDRIILTVEDEESAAAAFGE